MKHPRSNVCVHVFIRGSVCVYVPEKAVFLCLSFDFIALEKKKLRCCYFGLIFCVSVKQPSTSSPPQEASVCPLAYTSGSGCTDEPWLQSALQRPQTGEKKHSTMRYL